jgi:membrane protease YdiL (CAAX protease family)
MVIDILVRLVFILAITAFLLMRKENNKVEYFHKQTWTTREVLPVYWVFIFIFLIWLILFKINSDERLYIFASYILTFLAGSILFFAAKKTIGKRGVLSLKVIGAKSTDLYWLLVLIAIQYIILLVYLFNGNSALDYTRILMMLGYFSITLIFWPVIESVFYLGMMFIPTSRLVGLIKSAILISLLQALSHFYYNLPEVAINFTIFGLFGCFLYIKSKRIILPLMVHSSINFLVLIQDIKSLMP